MSEPSDNRFYSHNSFRDGRIKACGSGFASHFKLTRQQQLSTSTNTVPQAIQHLHQIVSTTQTNTRSTEVSLPDKMFRVCFNLEHLPPLAPVAHLNRTHITIKELLNE
jgi:hypothetical protein